MAGKRRLDLLLMLALWVVSCSRPPAAPLTFAPAGMNPTGAHTTNVSGGVTFWGNGSLRLRLYSEAGPLVVTVHARGSVADGEAPRVTARVDGQVIGTLSVDSPQIGEHMFSTRLHGAGMRLIEISFDNHLAKASPLAGRVLYIERVSIRTGA
jgi:hypothetical protein